MRTVAFVLVICTLLGVGGTAQAGCGRSASMYARQAIGDDADAATAAVAELRALGYIGLDALLALDDQFRADADQKGEPLDPTVARRLREAIDAVAAQRDAGSSRLYWHTDFDAALAEAQATGKPVLSLRLLGNLTDEYSCANSRFFRTVLYANAEVSAALRDRFVLHWQSVRPVPRITIDFGDGRRLERTITGNSIHYVLDSQGRVVDALPGLYGPRAFLRALFEADEAARGPATETPEDDASRLARLSLYHNLHLAQIARQWQQDLAALGVTVGQPLNPAQGREAVNAAPADAVAAGELAVSKSRIELPMLAVLGFADASQAGQALDAATNEELWQRIAELHAADAELDAGSRTLMRAKLPGAAQAGALAIGKRRVEDPLLRIVAEFQRSIALDTVRNEYQLHRQIHEWLAAGDAPAVDALNERVYAELFLTPSSDPWLGLAPAETYTALEGGGVVEADVN